MYIWTSVALAMVVIAPVVGNGWTSIKRYRGWALDYVPDIIEGLSIFNMADIALCERTCIGNPLCLAVGYNTVNASCVQKETLTTTFYHTGNMTLDAVSVIKTQPVYMIHDLNLGVLGSGWSAQANVLCNKLDKRLITYTELDSSRFTATFYSKACGVVQGDFGSKPAKPIDSNDVMANCSLPTPFAFCRDL